MINEIIVPSSNKPPPPPPRVIIRAFTVYPTIHFVAFFTCGRTKKVKKRSRRQTAVNESISYSVEFQEVILLAYIFQVRLVNLLHP